MHLKAILQTICIASGRNSGITIVRARRGVGDRITLHEIGVTFYVNRGITGAIVNRLKDAMAFASDCDSAIASEHLYLMAKDDMFGFLENSSHRKRLEKLHIERDVEYCLTPNQTHVIPLFQGDVLVKLEEIFS